MDLQSSATPTRIVSLLSSATEVLFALGLGDWVLAVSHECDWPAEAAAKPRATFSRVDSSQPSGAIDEQVKRLLAAGEPLYGIDEELIARLRPELIVTQAQCDVCAVRYDDVVRFVGRTAELAATRVVALNPMSLGDVLLDVQRVADAAGVGDVGRDVVAGLARRVDSVRQTTESLRADERPRTAIIEWTEPMMLAGNWTPELLTLAGGVCPLTAAGRHSAYVAWEQVRAFDPEVIVVAPCGFDLARSMTEAAGLALLPGWQDLAAVRNRHVVVVDGNAYFNRSGPRLVESLEMLGYLLHRGRVPRPGWVEVGREPWREV